MQSNVKIQYINSYKMPLASHLSNQYKRVDWGEKIKSWPGSSLVEVS